jgi:glycosyltransferase involved in cell wall biosynthesis
MAVPFVPGREARPAPSLRTLAAGIVAHNEERSLPGAVRSLVDQRLPEGVGWGEIWVVASGCTDATVPVARALAAQDARIRLLVEPDRGGKARAVGEVMRRARGDALVLLNSDARAEPGAVGALVGAAAGKPAPFAVMGRPVLSSDIAGSWAGTMRWMWDLHHEFHALLLAEGRGDHLSDELLLVSLASAPPIPAGVINDGSYFAVWLDQHGGGRWYAPDAPVSIQVPSDVRDHLRQRRRIHVGNRQITTLLGRPPASIPRHFLERPRETLRLVHRMTRRPGGRGHFIRIASFEVASHVLATWDRLPPRKDHIRWERIRAPAGGPVLDRPEPSALPSSGTPPAGAEERVAALLRIAGEYGTGVPLSALHELLPSDSPPSVEALRTWLEERPGLARVEGARAFAPTVTTDPTSEREQRAQYYWTYARGLWDGPLGFAQGLARCAGVTGSTAYGEPREGDDLDLFVVLRSGSLWWFLLRAYLALRVARWRDSRFRGPPPCLNYLLEEDVAAAEFAQRSDLLFAREALNVRVLHGDAYYRGLIASAPWMAMEVPRLYERRRADAGPIVPAAAPAAIRVLNAAVFPFLAAYLHVVGLVRNHGLRRAGVTERRFRTVTRLRRMAFASHRFDRLREKYRQVAVERRASGGGASAAAAPFGP